MNKETQRVMFSTGKGDHQTPKDFFELLHREFAFKLDVAASAENNLLPSYITEETNALSVDWSSRNFCNPPYGKEVGAWIHKAVEQQMLGKLVVMLLAGRVGTKWFAEAVETANEIRFVRGRLTFEGQLAPAPFPSIVVVWNAGLKTFDLLPHLTKYRWDTWRLR